MGTEFICKLIPLKKLRYFSAGYTNVDESVNLLQACYENPLFDDDGTLGGETHTKIHKQPDGFAGKPYDLNNGGAQTSVHYRQAQPRRKFLYCAGLLIACLAIVAIIVAIVISQRNSGKLAFTLFIVRR